MDGIISCLECRCCIYIGGGDYICGRARMVVVEGFSQPAANWMMCRMGSATCRPESGAGAEVPVQGFYEEGGYEG